MDGQQRGDGVVGRLHEVRGTDHRFALVAQRFEDSFRIDHAPQPGPDANGIGVFDSRFAGYG